MASPKVEGTLLDYRFMQYFAASIVLKNSFFRNCAYGSMGVLRVVTVLCALLLSQFPNSRGEQLAIGTGEFSFVDPTGNPDKPILVHYVRPKNFKDDGSIVFVMHGVNRNGDEYRDVWTRYAEERGFLVLAPEFSKEHYPSARQYNLGYMYDENGNLREKAKWSFMAIEEIFDKVVKDNELENREYVIYGHSAGGQFVHRFVLFMPEARYELAIAANPGWYTMPDFNVGFPYGLKGTEVSQEQLATVFGRRFVLMLGQNYTDSDDPNLTNTPETLSQGPHRFARGKAFIKQSRIAAKSIDTTLKWRMQVVPNAAHSNSRITTAAVKLVH